MTVCEGRWWGARLGCLVISGILGSGNALAEEQSGAEEQVAPEEQTAPVREKRADIERLMKVTKAADMGAQMGDLMAQQIVQLSGADTPEVIARCREIAAAAVREMLADQGLMKELVPVYDKHFSHQEIREMIAFYETPLGKKSIGVMPRVMADSMQIGQRWAARVMPEVREKVTRLMREEGLIE
ncbi:MAG: DUF2059 domain-containing protein [Gammaproteobacteria bacterium]|nr:DUF2059 domain-containing protein [Gammaproteobacteria bacterium]